MKFKTSVIAISALGMGCATMTQEELSDAHQFAVPCSDGSNGVSGCDAPNVVMHDRAYGTVTAGYPTDGIELPKRESVRDGFVLVVDPQEAAPVDPLPEQLANKCLTGSDGVEACGFDCKMGSDGSAACASAPEGECKISTDGSVVCGFNCVQGTDGMFVCGQSAGERCRATESGVVRCLPPSTIATAPQVVTPPPAPTQPPVEPPMVDPPMVEAKADMAEPMASDNKPDVWFKSEIITQDNADFREFNDDTFFERTFSDDRFTAARTKLFLSGSHEPHKELTFSYNAGVDATLGRFVSTSSGSFDVVVQELAATWSPLQEGAVQLRFGGGIFPVETGGDIDDDFFFNTSVTGLKLELDTPGGDFALVGLIDSFGYDSPSYSSVFAGERSGSFTSSNFGGDLSTFIIGGTYKNEDLVENLGLYAFGFYADIGAGPAPHTGSDRTLGGTQGTFDDGDYNWLAGLRAKYDLNAGDFKLGIMGEFARSGGIDRKNVQIGYRDVEANGSAFGAALYPSYQIGNKVELRGALRFFRADGAQHTAAEGLPFNYGFVGFRGSRLGGKALGGSAGWRPTSYVGSNGFAFDPSDRVRSGGTQFFRLGVGATFVERVSLDFDVWFLQDTSDTNFTDFDNVSSISDELPFGFTEGDVLAQQRFGESLGTEINIEATVHAVKDFFDIYLGYSVVLPSDFQSVPIFLVAGDLLGSANPPNFWLVSGGMELQF